MICAWLASTWARIEPGWWSVSCDHGSPPQRKKDGDPPASPRPVVRRLARQPPVGHGRGPAPSNHFSLSVGERAVRVHLADDLVDLEQESRVLRPALVDGHGQVLEEDRLADLHDRLSRRRSAASIDGARGDQQVELGPAGRDGLDAVRVRGPGHGLGAARAARTAAGRRWSRPDRGAGRQVSRRVVVRLGEAEDRLRGGGDRHRADADVPAAGPAAGGDDVPVLVLELGLDAEALGDLGPDVDVEADQRPSASGTTAARSSHRSRSATCRRLDRLEQVAGRAGRLRDRVLVRLEVAVQPVEVGGRLADADDGRNVAVAALRPAVARGALRARSVRIAAGCTPLRGACRQRVARA